MLRKFAVLLLTVCAINSKNLPSKKCKDCVLLSDCPGAVYLANNKNTSRTAGLIENALCSPERVRGIPRICCSDFPPSPSEIENHPNLSLLPTDCGVILGDRIVGGSEAKLFEFPWMALISYKTEKGKEFLCGGTLINSHYVLTAAHCVKWRSPKIILGVRLGEYDYRNKQPCSSSTCPIQDVAVVENFTYPAYSMSPYVLKDIALLRLRRPAKVEQKNIKPICLPVTKDLMERNFTDEKATVAGWGFTEIEKVSSRLLKVELPIYTDEECKRYYNRQTMTHFSVPSEPRETNSILCAGELNKDSCNGDSGGPLMLEGQYNEKFRYIQHGVVSHGPIQCGMGIPAVYTDVTWFMKWILDTIKP